MLICRLGNEQLWQNWPVVFSGASANVVNKSKSLSLKAQLCARRCVCVCVCLCVCVCVDGWWWFSAEMSVTLSLPVNRIFPYQEASVLVVGAAKILSRVVKFPLWKLLSIFQFFVDVAHCRRLAHELNMCLWEMCRLKNVYCLVVLLPCFALSTIYPFFFLITRSRSFACICFVFLLVLAEHLLLLFASPFAVVEKKSKFTVNLHDARSHSLPNHECRKKFNFGIKWKIKRNSQSAR